MSNCTDPVGYPCGAAICLSSESRPRTLLQIRTKQINKQVRMPSSQMIFRKRGMNVTKWLAEGENNITTLVK